MSTATAFPLFDGSGLDTTDPEFTDLSGIIGFSTTPTTITIDYGGGEFDVFLGTGIRDNGFAITGGTVTGVEYYFANQLVARATGFAPVPATQLQVLYEANDGQAVQELIFSGADSFTGSVASERIGALGGDDTMAGGGGDDTLLGDAGNDVIDGEAGNDSLLGGPGDDRLIGGEGLDSFDGGPGADSLVFAGSALIDPNDIDPRAPLAPPDGAVRPELGPAGPVSLATPAGAQTLAGIERIELEDGSYLYDIGIGPELAALYDRIGAGEIGEEERVEPVGDDLATVYRLYGAAYGRTPDEAGLRFWLDLFERDQITQRELAEAFITVPEFQLRYDGDPDTPGFQEPSDEAYISLLYDNALRRELDQGGFEFWVQRLESEDFDRVDMLIFFADSPENVTRTRSFLEDGVFVLPEDDMMM